MNRDRCRREHELTCAGGPAVGRRHAGHPGAGGSAEPTGCQREGDRRAVQQPVRHAAEGDVSEAADRRRPEHDQVGLVLRIPIGHGDGNFYADAETLQRIEDNDQVVFRYVENPNGSLHDIAGIVNEKRNVLGMMPHPDRSSEAILGSADGKLIFESMVNALARA